MWSPPAPQPRLPGTNPARAGRSPVARWARARTGETRAIRARAPSSPPPTPSALHELHALVLAAPALPARLQPARRSADRRAPDAVAPSSLAQLRRREPLTPTLPLRALPPGTGIGTHWTRARGRFPGPERGVKLR